MTDALRRIYNQFLRPILSTIEQVRRILKLLELLHIQFAAQLDAELAKLEQKLSLPLQLVISEFNKLTNRVEGYVLTADNLFVRATQLASIGRDIQSIGNISWNHMIDGINGNPKPRDGAPLQSLPAEQFAAIFEASAAGEETDDTAGAASAFDAAFDAVLSA